MKKLFTLFTAILFVGILFAQSPQKMSYQAVIRDASNKLVVNHRVGMQISILKSSEDGTVVYTETQTPNTNANGLVSIEIGGGAGFTTIDWANGPYFIKTETDPAGGADYTITGTSQLLSVPYALHAKTAETITGAPDISGIATAINAIQAEQITQNAAIALNTEKKGITTAQETILRHTSGSNSGDQDISGILINAMAIANEKARALASEGANVSAISDEVLRAKAAEEANVTAISDEKARALAAEGANATANSDEVLRAKAAEEANVTAISDEKARALAAEGANATAISDEVLRAKAAEGVNATAISDEKARALAAEGANATAISDEVLRAKAAEGVNATAISDEKVRALAAEGANATAISDEVLRAKAAEGVNTSDITNLKSEQTTQNAAIALNTAKVGITPTQANAITTNTSDITNLKSEQTTQNAAIALNTAKVGITPAQASAIVANTAKVGVTPGTEAGQMQYWNGTAWVTIAPTKNEGATLQMIGGVPTWTGGIPQIGSSLQGGIVVYIFVNGDPGYVAGETHGIIATPHNISSSAQWYNGNNIVTGATSPNIGGAISNTNKIVTAQGDGNYAAKLCYDYSITENGITYDDWWLPTWNELSKIRNSGLYWDTPWCSTESDYQNAGMLCLYQGSNYIKWKSSYTEVLPIRYF